MQNAIKFIYFDVGGVLLSWKGSIAKLARKHGKSHKHVYKVFSKYDQRFSRGGLSPKEVWLYYHKALQLKEQEDFDFVDFMTDHFTVIDETHKLAKDLSQSYSIGLLTNVYPGTYRVNVAKGHIPKIDYASIIRSCDIGLVKPEREIFQVAQEKAGVSHSQIFLIDDDKQNVHAARRFGWRAHHFDEGDPTKSVRAIRKMLVSI